MITDKVKELSGLPTTPEPTDDRYSRYNDGSTEVEVAEFLFGLVRVLKPNHILETGLYHGISSAYMALALKENRKTAGARYLGGHIDTMEIESQHIETSKSLFTKLDLQGFITIHQKNSLEYDPEYRFDLIFLDSELNIRLHELVKFYKALEPGGYFFIHDMPPTLCRGNKNLDHPEIVNYPVGEFPAEFDELLKTDKLRLIHFPSPRGLVGLYKPKEGDYHWK